MATRSTTSTSSTSSTPKPAAEPADAPKPAPEPAEAPKARTTAKAPKREQKGGTILEDGRPVGYTRDGALSATEGGVKDPTILPPEPTDPTEGAA